MKELDVLDCLVKNRCSISLINFTKKKKKLNYTQKKMDMFCNNNTFPKGDTSCWSAVILSPNFSFLICKHKMITMIHVLMERQLIVARDICTLKVGNGDGGALIRDFFVAGSLLLLLPLLFFRSSLSELH